MKNQSFRLLGVLLLLFFAKNCLSQETAITNVTLIDVATGKTTPRQTIIISSGKIAWVGPVPKAKTSAQTSIIDGSGKYLMPGLVDSHIHFFQSGSLYTRPDAIDFTSLMPYENERKAVLSNTLDYFNRYLRLGITTVVDVGGPFGNFLIRDSLSKNNLSPNVLVTGPLFSMVDSKKLESDDSPIVKVSSNADIEALFNKMLPYKPDFIKVWYIAGRELPAKQSFPLVRYLGELCAKNNLKLAVHATELETARLAVDAGAKILVHSVDDEIIPDAFIKTLKDKGVTYIPTLIVSRNYSIAFSGKLPHHPQDLAFAPAAAYGTLTDPNKIDTAKWPQALKWVRKNGIPKIYARYDSIMKVNLKKLFAAGVNIATGTDAGNIGTFHASSYLQELETMKEAGLTNAEILKASTINAASGFGLGSMIGTVSKGKQADLILLGKNPLEDLANLNTITHVIRNGQVLHADSILKESPEAIVQRQLNAYNARNADAFADTYAEDIELYNSEGKLLMKGREELRKSYGEYFQSTPDLYCEIENRIVINNKIIDKEKVRSNGQVFSAVAVYEVNEGKIKKVTFIR